MNTNSTCCGGMTTGCDSAIAELPRYYPRQLITPADLTLEQYYFRDRLRRHNRLLHGWGVVCGALVCPVGVRNADGTMSSYSPWLVQVQAGYILGPYGDEILIDCARTVDVRTQGVSGVTGETCIDAPDPWCTEVFTPPTTTNPTVYYIAVQYLQSKTRPVRVQPVGCGCDDSSCEYSRWHDGYQIGVLSQCPTCNQVDDQHPPPDFDRLRIGNIPACPDCSCGPWVGLAAVTVNADGTIAQIDNCTCRRMVLSFANFWWRCTGTLSTLVVTDQTTGNKIPPSLPISITAGVTTQTAISVTGNNLDAKATYILGEGITVTNTTDLTKWVAGNPVTLNVQAIAGAAPGNRTLIVVNPDCSTAILANVINVAGAASALKTAATPKGGAVVAKQQKKPPEG
jgi:hypothetical protein